MRRGDRLRRPLRRRHAERAVRVQQQRDHPAHADLGDARRPGQPRRADASPNASSNTAPRPAYGPACRAVAARVRHQPGGGLREDRGSRAEHRIPLPRRDDELRRHGRRPRHHVPDAAGRGALGRNERLERSRGELGDALRERQPAGRVAQRVHVRIRHHDRLRVERAVRGAARVRVEPRRGVRVDRLRAGCRAPNTTTGSRATNSGGTSKGEDATFKTTS